MPMTDIEEIIYRFLARHINCRDVVFYDLGSIKRYIYDELQIYDGFESLKFISGGSSDHDFVRDILLLLCEKYVRWHVVLPELDRYCGWGIDFDYQGDL